MLHKLELTDVELAVISECLMLGAYGKVAPVVNAINEQLAKAREKEAAE